MIQASIDWIMYGLAGLDPASHAMKSLNFFLSDTVKILLMLFVFSGRSVDGDVSVGVDTSVSGRWFTLRAMV